jgi:signal transduction histidine kinase
LTESFNHMVDELDERARREARFASDVSHDLRGPLTALAAATAVVHRRRGELPAEALVAVDALEEQVESFNSLVVDLLEISRFEAGTAALDLRPVDLEELVRAVLSEGEFDVPIVTGAGGPFRAVVDPRRLQRVLVNLLGNAANYAGGATSVVVGADGPGRVQIAVEDHGPGVPAELREAIFSRYERGRAATDPDAAKGTGLGLALAAQHVKLHGGTIHVEDNDGGGARFVVTLPEDAA